MRHRLLPGEISFQRQLVGPFQQLPGHRHRLFGWRAQSLAKRGKLLELGGVHSVWLGRRLAAGGLRERRPYDNGSGLWYANIVLILTCLMRSPHYAPLCGELSATFRLVGAPLDGGRPAQAQALRQWLRIMVRPYRFDSHASGLLAK